MSAGLPFAASLAMLTACSDNQWSDVDGKAPDVQLAVDAVHTEPGMTIAVRGKVTDADGIASIYMECADLNLRKTIDIIDIYGEPLKEYDLDYQFQTARRTEGMENFTVTLRITDVGGRVTVKEFGANLDGDFTAPYFTAKPSENITVLIKKETKIKINVSVADNRLVGELEVNLKKISGTDSLPVAGYPITVKVNSPTYDWKGQIPVPSEPATYFCTVTVKDAPAGSEPNVAVATSNINVMDLPDFDAIFLSDVKTAAELNSDLFGVPIAMDHVGNYKYRVRYYNEKAGTEICFLGQRTDFGPICFAPSKDNAAELGDDPEEVNRIVLDKAGVYYEFFVDTYNRTYTKREYSKAEAINPVMHMAYGANLLNTWWDWNVADPWMQEFYFGPASGPQSVQRMEQDPNNPNIFYCRDMDVTAGKKLDFMVHNWHSNGWWNFVAWRSDNKTDPSKFVYYGNLHPDNPYYTGNTDYFTWKYKNMDPEEYKFQFPKAVPFDINKWSDEGYRKNFIGDNWVNVVPEKSGKYTFKIDLHAERGWMYPQN